MKWILSFLHNNDHVSKTVCLFCILLLIIVISWVVYRFLRTSETEGLVSHADDLNLKEEYVRLEEELAIITGNDRDTASSLDLLADELSQMEDSSLNPVIRSIFKKSNIIKQFYKTFKIRYLQLEDVFALLDNYRKQDENLMEIEEKRRKAILLYQKASETIDEEYNKEMNRLNTVYDMSLTLLKENYMKDLENADAKYNESVIIYEADDQPKYSDISGNDWYKGEYRSFPLDASTDYLLACQNQCSQDICCNAIEVVKTETDIRVCSLLYNSTGVLEFERHNYDWDPPHKVYQKVAASRNDSSPADVRNQAYVDAKKKYEAGIIKAATDLDALNDSSYLLYLEDKNGLTDTATKTLPTTVPYVEAVNISDANYRQMFELVSEMRFYVNSAVDAVSKAENALMKQGYNNMNIPSTLNNFLAYYYVPEKEGFTGIREGATGSLNTSDVVQLFSDSFTEADILPSPNPARPKGIPASYMHPGNKDIAPIKQFNVYADMQYNGKPLKTISDISAVDCLTECSNSSQCVGFNYDRSNKKCILFDSFRDTEIMYDYQGKSGMDLYYTGTLKIPPPDIKKSAQALLYDSPLSNNQGKTDDYLYPGEQMLSANKAYSAFMKPDGNFQVMNLSTGAAMWSLTTGGGVSEADLIPGSSLVLTKEGGVIVYDYVSGTTIWFLSPENYVNNLTGAGLEMNMDDNGNLVVFCTTPDSTSSPVRKFGIWSTQIFDPLDTSQFSNEPYCYVQNLYAAKTSSIHPSTSPTDKASLDLTADPEIKPFLDMIQSTSPTFSQYMSDRSVVPTASPYGGNFFGFNLTNMSNTSSGGMRSEMVALLPAVAQHYRMYGFYYGIDKGCSKVPAYPLKPHQLICYAETNGQNDMSAAFQDWITTGFLQNKSFNCPANYVPPVIPQTETNCYFTRYKQNGMVLSQQGRLPNEISRKDQQTAQRHYQETGFWNDYYPLCNAYGNTTGYPVPTKPGYVVAPSNAAGYWIPANTVPTMAATQMNEEEAMCYINRAQFLPNSPYVSTEETGNSNSLADQPLNSLAAAYQEWGSDTGFFQGKINSCQDMTVDGNKFDLSVLYPGQMLQYDEFIQSPNGVYRAGFDFSFNTVAKTGNFCVYKTNNSNEIKWSLSDLKGYNGQCVVADKSAVPTSRKAIMTTTGEFVISDSEGVIVSSIWLSGKKPSKAHVRLSDQGILAVYSDESEVIWSTAPPTSFSNVLQDGQTLHPNQFLENIQRYQMRMYYDNLAVVDPQGSVVWDLSSCLAALGEPPIPLFCSLTLAQNNISLLHYTDPLWTTVWQSYSRNGLPTSDLEMSSWGFLQLINMSQQIFWATFLTSISLVPGFQSTNTISLAGMESNFRQNMIFDSNGVYALFFDASGVLQSRNMVQGGNRAVVYSFATLYGGTIQEKDTPFFPAVPYNPYEQAPFPTQTRTTTTPYKSTPFLTTTPYKSTPYYSTKPNMSPQTQITNPFFSQGVSSILTPKPMTQGPTQKPYGTPLKIRLNNGDIKPLMAMSNPLNPYLTIDGATGNIIVYDSGGSIVFCLEMVNVKYNNFTSFTIDAQGNWVVSNKYSPGPEYNWNSGNVVPVFEYIGNNSYKYYDKNNSDYKTNVLYSFNEPMTTPYNITTTPYNITTTTPYNITTTTPYNITTTPKGSTPPPKPLFQFMCVDSDNNIWYTKPIDYAPNSNLEWKLFPMEKNVAQISFSNGKAAGVYSNTGANSFLIGNDGTVVDFTSANLKQLSYYGGQNGRSFVIGVNTGNEIWYSNYDFDTDITIMNGQNPYKYGIDTTAIKANYVSYAVDPSTGNDYVAVIDTAGDIQFFSMKEKSRNAMFPRPSTTKVSPTFYPITSDLLLTCMTMQIISTKQGVSMVNIVASSAVDNSKTGSAYLISFPVNNPNGDNIILLNTTPKTSLITGIPNAMGITTISVSSSLPSNTFYMRDTTGRSYFLSDYTDINNFKGNAKAIENAVQLMLTNNKSIIQVSMDVYSHTNKPSWTPGEIITPKSYDYVYTNFDSQGSWNAILPNPYFTTFDKDDADDKCNKLCDKTSNCIATSVYDAGNGTKQCRLLDKIAGLDSTNEYITYVENVNLYSTKKLKEPANRSYVSYLNYDSKGYTGDNKDLIGFKIPNKSGRDIDALCREACNYNPKCKLCTVWNDGTDRHCILKSGINNNGLNYNKSCNTYVSNDSGINVSTKNYIITNKTGNLRVNESDPKNIIIYSSDGNQATGTIIFFSSPKNLSLIGGGGGGGGPAGSTFCGHGRNAKNNNLCEGGSGGGGGAGGVSYESNFNIDYNDSYNFTIGGGGTGGNAGANSTCTKGSSCGDPSKDGTSGSQGGNTTLNGPRNFTASGGQPGTFGKGRGTSDDCGVCPTNGTGGLDGNGIKSGKNGYCDDYESGYCRNTYKGSGGRNFSNYGIGGDGEGAPGLKVTNNNLLQTRIKASNGTAGAILISFN
jgi:hypothetical protein